MMREKVMKVFIKNKLVSIGGSSSVTDENGTDVFKVKGKAVSVTRKKYVCDLEDKVLFSVRNRWINLIVHKAFVYDADKRKIAVVKNKPFSLKRAFKVDCVDGEITFDGEFFSLSSRILRNGSEIGVLRRDLTIVRDSFSLDADEKDMPFLVALVIAIDNIVDNTKK